MILRSRFVLPVHVAPIENGAIAIDNSRITYVGPFRYCPKGQEVVDCGDSILLPGLINSHCHLDYTQMSGKIPQPKCFTDWIPWMLSLKAAFSPMEYRASWLEGARMLLKCGVTTVANVESVPVILSDIHQETPLRVFSFIEMTGVNSRRAPQLILQEAIDVVMNNKLKSAGLSPHAPYSTFPELLRLSGHAARQHRWRVMTHVAESRDEWDMFVSQAGPLYSLLKKQRDMSDCGDVTPIEHLEKNELLGENVLLAHANYLNAEDVERISRSGSSVIHCPQSHEYFQHKRFPWEDLYGARINLCLGTDSLATVIKSGKEAPDLNIFSEMQLLQTHYGLEPETVVRSVTLNGAKALGLSGVLGELSVNAKADVIVIPFSGNVSGTWDAVVHHFGAVDKVMIEGRWIAPSS